jgi:hypothetical protein
MQQDARVTGLTTQDATLIAAGIAAAASLAKLITDALSARGAASRAAHRTVLEPHLSGLATSIHGVVAGAVIAHRRLSDGQEAGNALENSREAAATLKRNRLEVKYALPGLEEPLRTLTRAPDWIATCKGRPQGNDLLLGLTRLSRLVDATITRSYRRGRPPSRWEQWRLSRTTKHVRGVWTTRWEGSDDDPQE